MEYNYMGRQQGEEVQKNLGENLVLQLSSRFRNTNHNITTDNFFSLREQKLGESPFSCLLEAVNHFIHSVIFLFLK